MSRGSQCVMSTFVVAIIVCWLVVGCCTTGRKQTAETAPVPEKKETGIMENWGGDFPVVELGRLPEDQQDTPVGYIGDAATFTSVWEVFKPDEEVPDVDFEKDIVVFSRNVDFYNRTSIMKVELENGVAEIVAMETMSAMPIENNVAMALAVVPREGIKFIQSGDAQIPVRH